MRFACSPVIGCCSAKGAYDSRLATPMADDLGLVMRLTGLKHIFQLICRSQKSQTTEIE
jgi:hypothetical protein